jgi:Obg family GTPase CgtA-like protein
LLSTKKPSYSTNSNSPPSILTISPLLQDDDGAYVVSGNAIERMFKMTDFNSDPAVRRFARQMRSMGIDDALRERGCSNGDIVRILGGLTCKTSYCWITIKVCHFKHAFDCITAYYIGTIIM